MAAPAACGHPHRQLGRQPGRRLGRAGGDAQGVDHPARVEGVAHPGHPVVAQRRRPGARATSRRALARTRPSSSRVTVREAATTARSSRRRSSLPADWAVVARSFQLARLTTGSSCSAMASSGSALAGRPRPVSAFCSAMAWRTAGMPPRSSCSATGSCSGPRVASRALRWAVDTVGLRSRSRAAAGRAVTSPLGTGRHRRSAARPSRRGAGRPGPPPGPRRRPSRRPGPSRPSRRVEPSRRAGTVSALAPGRRRRGSRVGGAPSRRPAPSRRGRSVIVVAAAARPRGQRHRHVRARAAGRR